MISDILNKAIDLHKTGKIYEAENLYKEIINVDPENHTAFYLLGIIAYDDKNIETAEKYLEKSIQLNPNNSDAHFLLGNIYLTKQNPQNAINCYQKSLLVNPDNIEANFNLGLVFEKAGYLDNAIEYYKKTINLDPNHVQVYFNLANILYQSKNQPDDAINLLKRALQIAPNCAEIYGNLGYIYYNSKKDPQNAINCFKKALELKQDMPVVHYNLGRSLLLTGNFEEGWKHFIKRNYIMENYRLQYGPFLESLDNIQGKTIFIYHVAGFGDTVGYARYLPLLESMGAKVICKPQTALTQLFRQSNLKAEILDESIPDAEIKFDYQASFMVLPALFNSTPETVPFKNNYLSADPVKVDYLKNKYFMNNSYKVGIVWKCSNSYGFDVNRSIPELSYFYKLAQLPDIQLYSLQKGAGEEQLNDLPGNVSIIDISKEFNDFSDTAAAIENLDLLIAVDTSVIHVSGALNKKTWTLLPYSPDWKWLLDEETTYWYNNMKLLRQQEPGDWKSVLENVYRELENILVRA